MRLLWIVPYVPNRIRVRPYELLRALVARGHTITLATLLADESEVADVEVLRRLGITVLVEPLTRQRSLWNAARTLPTHQPLQSRWSDVPALRRRIVEQLQAAPPDAIHVEHMRGAGYALVAHEQRLAATGAPKPTVVWDSVDSISLLFAQAAVESTTARARWMARLELDRTRRMEGRLARAFDHTVVTAASDAEEFRRLAGADAPIRVIPNGVDLETFHPPESQVRAPARVVLSGKMSYHANVTAAMRLVREIMPLVWAQRPDAEVWLVGTDPAPEVKGLAGARVTVTGAVDSMATVLQAATLAAAPVIYGVGIQNKVLEAMACGMPVVASGQAAAALQAIAEQDYLAARSPHEFASAILALLADADLCARLGAAGRAYVERHHSWQAAAAQFEALYASASSPELSPIGGTESVAGAVEQPLGSRGTS